MTTKFQTVARVDEIPVGEGRAFPVDGVMVAVFNTDGVFTAINDTCPHMGASLASGYVEEAAVMCPWHAWRFCVKDGTWLDNPKIKVDTYQVRVVDDEVQVSVIEVEPPKTETKPEDEIQSDNAEESDSRGGEVSQ